MERPQMIIRNLNHIVLDWSKTFVSEESKEIKSSSVNNEDNETLYQLQICNQVKEWATTYCGPKRQFKVENLSACTCYNFRIKRTIDCEWIYFKGATDDIGPYSSVMHMTRAVKLGKTAVIRKMAQLKPHLLNAENKENKTPLIQATENGDIQICHLLINLGANVNKSLRFTKRTPLMIAVYEGKLHIASLLIDKGAHTSLRDINGLNILHHSVDSNKVENVEFVLQHNLDVNVQDNCGWTPLLRAGCSQEIIQVLLDHGAKKNVLDKFGFDFEKHKRLTSKAIQEKN